MSAFLLDIIEESKVEKEEERVVHDEGSIWENCDGKEIPREKAKKYGIPYNEELGCYETNGHLSRDGIENAIKNWKKSDDPDEVMAREDGKFTHVQGRIYKIFNRDVHSINPFPIPKNLSYADINNKNVIQALQSKFTTKIQGKGDIVPGDLLTLGLVGDSTSQARRAKVCQHFHLGPCNVKTMVKRLNVLGIPLSDIQKVL
jgi:hypothetical protein